MIAISGKKGSGKDTVYMMFQYLDYLDWNGKYTSLNGYKLSFKEWQKDINKYAYMSRWIKKIFDDKIKQIVSILIGCNKKELENKDFRSTILGEEWTRYAYATGHTTDNNGKTSMLSTPCSKDKYEEERIVNWQTAYKFENSPNSIIEILDNMFGKKFITLNIWINALFFDYKLQYRTLLTLVDPKVFDENDEEDFTQCYPNWFITDMRYINEFEAIKERKGITIRINRPIKCPECGVTGGHKMVPHENKELTKEDELNSITHDYNINNDAGLEELLEKVKIIRNEILSEK